MANGAFISYLRVSTDRQGKSGLGLEAQRKAVTDYLNGGAWNLVSEFVEIESGSKDDRPQLAAALKACRVHSATLVIAKLDRLSRDVHFLTGLQRAGVRFVAADMPEANEMVVQMMAVVAQAERKMIGARTKAALERKRAWYANLTTAERAELIAKKKAVQLGGDRGNIRQIAVQGRVKAAEVNRAKAAGRAVDLAPIIADIQAAGAASLRDIARGLNERGIPTTCGGSWSAVQVQRIIAKAA